MRSFGLKNRSRALKFCASRAFIFIMKGAPLVVQAV
jgi:hypothetical protein